MNSNCFWRPAVHPPEDWGFTSVAILAVKWPEPDLAFNRLT